MTLAEKTGLYIHPMVSIAALVGAALWVSHIGRGVERAQTESETNIRLELVKLTADLATQETESETNIRLELAQRTADLATQQTESEANIRLELAKLTADLATQVGAQIHTLQLENKELKSQIQSLSSQGGDSITGSMFIEIQSELEDRSMRALNDAGLNIDSWWLNAADVREIQLRSKPYAQ